MATTLSVNITRPNVLFVSLCSTYRVLCSRSRAHGKLNDGYVYVQLRTQKNQMPPCGGSASPGPRGLWSEVPTRTAPGVPRMGSRSFRHRGMWTRSPGGRTPTGPRPGPGETIPPLSLSLDRGYSPYRVQILLSAATQGDRSKQ